MATIYTIGFSGKKQDVFTDILAAAGIKKLIDIRLWRAVRFVPWANGENLASVLGDKYLAMPELAPTKELLTAYKDGAIDWTGYEKVFNELLHDRAVEKLPALADLDEVCFLCSEKTADQCHRRLVAEYLAAHHQDTKIVHLL